MILMNKYQKYCFFRTLEPSDERFPFRRCAPAIFALPENAKLYKEKANVVYGRFDLETDTFTVFQDEDIELVEYILVATGNLGCIDAVYFYKNDVWEPCSPKLPNGNDGYAIILNFNDRVQKVKITFKHNIADDYIFDIKYVEADREAYYAKKEEDRKEGLLKAADIKFSTGVDLVNIYFQPCCKQYDYTEIQLYIPKEYERVHGRKKPSSWSLIKKAKIPPEEFYKSINGLAYGLYSFVIKQFDARGNLLIETGKIEFSIEVPSGGMSKPFVYIH